MQFSNQLRNKKELTKIAFQYYYTNIFCRSINPYMIFNIERNDKLAQEPFIHSFLFVYFLISLSDFLSWL